MPLDRTPVALKLLYACDQCHSSRVFIFLPVHTVNCVETLKVTTVTRYTRLKKGEGATIRFNPKTWEIEVKNVKGKAPMMRIDVSQIREIRGNDIALRSAEFAEGPEIVEDMGAQQRSICILYGNEFKLDQLAFVTDTADEYLAWMVRVSVCPPPPPTDKTVTAEESFGMDGMCVLFSFPHNFTLADASLDSTPALT
jgi:hypothetical protein